MNKDWFNENDIKINNVNILNDIKGYVLPHAGTKYTKQVLNSTLQFKPNKKFKNIYIYYLPANDKENINVNGKKYYHEYYVPWMALKLVFNKYWNWNLKEIKFKGINMSKNNNKYKYDKEGLYIISADFSHHLPFQKSLKLEDCAARSIMFRNLNDNKDCIDVIDHMKSFEELFKILNRRFVFQWIGRSRSEGNEGVGYLSFLIRTNPTIKKISKSDGFFVTCYDTSMNTRECLGYYGEWSKEAESNKVNEVITKGQNESRLTSGRNKNLKVKFYTITYLFEDKKNPFIRGYHAIKTTSLYLPEVFLEHTYENGKWIKDTDKKWNHNGNYKFNMKETYNSLDYKTSSRGGVVSESEPIFYKTNVVHKKIKNKK